MIISLILAAATNNVIGNNGRLPWKIPADMKFFRVMTMGKPVLMGRKTFDSIGKPLVGRANLVLTRNEDWSFPGTTPVQTIQQAIAIAKQKGAAELMVIGGAEIYSLVMPIADRIYLTRVDQEPEGNAFFPAIDEKVWIRECNVIHPGYSFQLWQRLSELQTTAFCDIDSFIRAAGADFVMGG